MSKNSKLIGFALRKAGVPMAELIAQMLCKKPVTPDLPTATQYLYGHVAGADETPDVYIDGVGYVGAVLPALPEWDSEQYPYVCIMRNDYFTACDFMSAPEYSKNDGKIYLAKGTSVSEYYLTDGAWVHQEDFVLAYEDVTLSEYVVWASYDILNTDETVHLQGADPIPVGEIVGYCGGGYRYMLPDSAFEYEYIAIVEDPSNVRLIATNNLEFGSTDSATYGTQYLTKAKKARVWKLNNGEWVLEYSSTDYQNVWNNSSYVHGYQNADWANKDIPCKQSDGTEYIAREGTDPIPVYERGETV